MEDLKVLEPFPMTGPGADQFPESEERPEGMRSVDWHAADIEAMVDVRLNIVYQSLSGEDQHLQLFLPLEIEHIPVKPEIRPLIIFVPGSAWHRQNVWMGLEKARYFASRGYVFAIVEYRPSDIAVFPSQIRDVETATRYLLEHREEYLIDPNRIVLWGDSSGGHTVVSLAVERPDLAKCVVDWFGPTDIEKMNCYPSVRDHRSPDSAEGCLMGGVSVLENRELFQKANPLNMISDEVPLPSFLIFHGSRDDVVPFNQSVRLYEKLRECGKDAQFYRLEGAGHGTKGFTSREALETTLDWIREKLQ